MGQQAPLQGKSPFPGGRGGAGWSQGQLLENECQPPCLDLCQAERMPVLRALSFPGMWLWAVDCVQEAHNNAATIRPTHPPTHHFLGTIGDITGFNVFSFFFLPFPEEDPLPGP